MLHQYNAKVKKKKKRGKDPAMSPSEAGIIERENSMTLNTYVWSILGTKISLSQSCECKVHVQEILSLV